MSIKGFFKSKTIGEYLAARKNPEKMAEIESRGMKKVLSNSVSTVQKQQQVSEAIKQERLVVRCKFCKSTNVDFLQQDKKFSIGKAALGTAIVGDMGVVAGVNGKMGKKEWHCQNCGKVFETK